MVDKHFSPEANTFGPWFQRNQQLQANLHRQFGNLQTFTRKLRSTISIACLMLIWIRLYMHQMKRL